jgi:hypothetical protein
MWVINLTRITHILTAMFVRPHPDEGAILGHGESRRPSLRSGVTRQASRVWRDSSFVWAAWS